MNTMNPPLYAPILLIEDNEQNSYLLGYLLRQYGFEVLLAADGLRGLEMAKTTYPLQMVLLDIQLPRMDGYAVARALRAMPGLQQTPIVAVTSYAMVGDREKCLEAGCNGYIEKPINPETFVEEIRAIAAQQGRAPE